MPHQPPVGPTKDGEDQKRNGEEIERRHAVVEKSVVVALEQIAGHVHQIFLSAKTMNNKF